MIADVFLINKTRERVECKGDSKVAIQGIVWIRL